VTTAHYVARADVRFTPESRHQLSAVGCPLCAKSGNRLYPVRRLPALISELIWINSGNLVLTYHLFFIALAAVIVIR